VGDTVKNSTQYKFASDLAKSISVVHYLPDLSWVSKGCVVDKVTISLDGNGELKVTASGPGRERVTPAPEKPGAFTTVGSPVTGILGGALVNGTAVKLKKFDFDIANAMALANDEIGTDRAEEYWRDGERDVTFSLDQRVRSDTTISALAEAATDFELLVWTGNAEGRMFAIYIPKAELDNPESPDGTGQLTLSYKGLAKENAGNDEAVISFG